MINGFVEEIFASIQGEGPYVGQRHIFVRFIGCDLDCRYCDTPAAKGRPASGRPAPCNAQVSPDADRREAVPGPLDGKTLLDLCQRLVIPGPAKPIVSLTGGEPLLHAPFLASWLPGVRERFSLYLETNGIHADALRKLLPFIDTVSMDIKLPSATGQAGRWEEHRAFLAATAGKERYVKTVVTHDTNDDDVETAVRLVASQDPSITFVLQPASGSLAPPIGRLILMQNEALRALSDVRVIPQVHRILDIP